MSNLTVKDAAGILQFVGAVPQPDGSLAPLHATTPAGGIVADHSGTPPALGALLATIPSNPFRKFAFVQNQSGNVLQVVLDDGNGSTPLIILVDPGAGTNRQGGDWDTRSMPHTGRIRICGPAGSQFGAGEV